MGTFIASLDFDRLLVFGPHQHFKWDGFTLAPKKGSPLHHLTYSTEIPKRAGKDLIQEDLSWAKRKASGLAGALIFEDELHRLGGGDSGTRFLRDLKERFLTAILAFQYHARASGGLLNLGSCRPKRFIWELSDIEYDLYKTIIDRYPESHLKRLRAHRKKGETKFLVPIGWPMNVPQPDLAIMEPSNATAIQEGLSSQSHPDEWAPHYAIYSMAMDALSRRAYPVTVICMATAAETALKWFLFDRFKPIAYLLEDFSSPSIGHLAMCAEKHFGLSISKEDRVALGKLAEVRNAIVHKPKGRIINLENLQGWKAAVDKEDSTIKPTKECVIERSHSPIHACNPTGMPRPVESMYGGGPARSLHPPHITATLCGTYAGVYKLVGYRE